MLLIDNEATASVLTLSAVVAVLEQAHQDLAAGHAVCRLRIDMRFPVGDAWSVYQWGSMEGSSASSAPGSSLSQGHIYEQRRERGLGRELSTSWFLQDIRG